MKGITISANNVTVNGFTFSNVGTQVNVTGGTSLFLSGDVVENNIFSGYTGVGLVPAYAGNLVVEGNLFENASTAGAGSEAMQFHSDSATAAATARKSLTTSSWQR